MPAPATATDFVSLLKRSQLVPEDQVAQALETLPIDVISGPVDRLATQFVRTGVLTKFQARQIAQGRYKRFTIAEKYLLLEHIGTGGMGAVYLCEHMLMRRLVAIKVLPLDKIASDPSALQRFHREARAVASLDHPNIVHAYDIDKSEQVHYLVMEYVDGTSLQEIVARYSMKKEWFDIHRAVNATVQAAEGLQHAHELGLIHRDVKPGNLLLDRSGTIKVLDLGLARFFDHRHDGLTKKFDDNCVLGTADYLSPEQALMEEVDARADVYGLGGTLYFLLTGSSPFPDGTIAQKLISHQKQTPKPVTDFRKDVPKELIAIIRKMMAKNPDDRYQTCAEAAQALAPWMQEPIDRPPASEMPDLCPAVMKRIENNTMSGRITGSLSTSGTYRALPRSGGSVVKTDFDTTQSSVPTGRSSSTMPISARQRPSRDAEPSISELPIISTRPEYFWLLLAAVALGSFLFAAVLVSALFLFVIR